MRLRTFIPWCWSLVFGFGAFERLVIRLHRASYDRGFARGRLEHGCVLRKDYHAACEAMHAHRGRLGILEARTKAVEDRLSELEKGTTKDHPLVHGLRNMGAL
jgi:hypothetical protein